MAAATAAAAVAGREREPGKVSFAIDDLDLTGYNPSMLRLIQNNRLLLRTRFPKVVVVLLGKPELKRWYGSHCPNGRVERLVDILVDVVSAYTINYQGNVFRRTIDLNDHGFWKLLVSRVIGSEEATAATTKARGCENESAGAPVDKCHGEGGEAVAGECYDRGGGGGVNGVEGVDGVDQVDGEDSEDAHRHHLAEDHDGSSGTRRRRRRKTTARGSARHFATRKADPCYDRMPPPPLPAAAAASNPSRFSTTSIHV